MGQQEMQAWRRELNQFFHDARAELQEIIAAVDQILAVQPHIQADPVAVRHTAYSAPMVNSPAPVALTNAIAADPMGTDANSAGAHELSDFSQRLDQLKRQLNQRLQERPVIGDESIPNVVGESQ